MRFSSFTYLVGQGLHNLKANKMMTLASMGVLIVCMIFTVIRRSRDRCESDFFDSCFFSPAVSFSDFEIRPSLSAGRAFSQMISFEKSGLPAKAEQMAAGGKRILPIIAIG